MTNTLQFFSKNPNIVPLILAFTLVHCKVCSEIDGRQKLLMLKHNLQKHTRRQKCKVTCLGCVVGQYIMSIESQHVKSKHLFANKGQNFVVNMVCVGGLVGD